MKLEVVYRGVEVTYDEDRNDWSFELRGRARRTDTLKAAKEAIDTPAKEKKEPFKRFEGFLIGFGSLYGDKPFAKVTVSSYAEKAYGIQDVWVIRADGERRKNFCCRDSGIYG